MQYPEIDALRVHLKSLSISLSYEQLPDDNLSPYYYRRIIMAHENETYSMPVYDEYDDALSGRPLLLFHLVLQECEEFEETDSFEAWALDQGLPAGEVGVQKIYAELQRLVPPLRKIIGYEASAIPSMDVQLNTGLAQALRKADLE